MPTDPEHIDEVVTHLRILHKREFDTVEEYEEGTSTYSEAADLITELADKLALWEGAIHDALDEMSGGKHYDAEVILAESVGRDASF